MIGSRGLIGKIAKVAISAVSLIVCLSFPNLNRISSAADEVGKTVRVKNDVSGSLGNRRLAPSDPVYETEKIFAQSNSHGELRLIDNSKVLVGENSTVSLDDFTVGKKGFDSGTFKVAKGAFRLITGNSKKNSMSVETPLATIGARGTVFDVYVGPGGVTRVILFSGAVQVCSSARCVLVEDPCNIVEVNSSTIRELDYLKSGDTAEEDEAYSLVNKQTRFNSSWRAPLSGCYARAAFDSEVQLKRRLKNKSNKIEGNGPNGGAPAPQDDEGDETGGDTSSDTGGEDTGDDTGDDCSNCGYE